MSKTYLIPVLFVLVAFGMSVNDAHAQSKPTQIPGAKPSEARTVPGIVSSVQVDRILLTGPGGSGNLTYNIFVGAKTQIVKGQTPMQLSDIKVGMNVTAQGTVDLRTLTMQAERIELPGAATATTSGSVQAGEQHAATTGPAATEPAAKGQGFWVRLWHTLFGWLKR